jgi:hypothetical protein
LINPAHVNLKGYHDPGEFLNIRVQQKLILEIIGDLESSCVFPGGGGKLRINVLFLSSKSGG